MPENIVNLLDKIASVKGQDYANGLVDMANLLVPNNDPGKDSAEQTPRADNTNRRVK